MRSALVDRGRKGDWIQTYTGKAFFPLDPIPEEVDILDIAHALAMQCRYGGHCLKFYSVAEHCVHVSRLCSMKNKLAGLLHDRSEAYAMDLPRPIKWHMPEYKAIEHTLDLITAIPFGLEVPMPDEVKMLDEAILDCERNAIMSKPPYDWQVRNTIGISIQICCWTPEQAEHEFLATYHELVKL